MLYYIYMYFLLKDFKSGDLINDKKASIMTKRRKFINSIIDDSPTLLANKIILNSKKTPKTFVKNFKYVRLKRIRVVLKKTLLSTMTQISFYTNFISVQLNLIEIIIDKYIKDHFSLSAGRFDKKYFEFIIKKIEKEYLENANQKDIFLERLKGHRNYKPYNDKKNKILYDTKD